MTLKRMSTVDGQNDLTRLAVVDISAAVKGHRGWETACFANKGSAVKFWAAAAIMTLILMERQKIQMEEKQRDGIEYKEWMA